MVAIEVFRQGLLRNLDLFAKLTKVGPYTMEKAHGEAKKFINLERELKLGRKGKSIMEAILEKKEEE